MKTTRAISRKVMWIGKATTFCVGLAVVLALVLGVATTALAGTGVGAAFNLGKTNAVNQLSSLVGSAAGAMLKVDNNGSGPALDLRVGSATVAPGTKTTPPMKVDSGAKVANLNADKLDGQDSTQLWSGRSYTTYRTAQGQANAEIFDFASCDNGDKAIGGGYDFGSTSTGYSVTTASSFADSYELFWYSDSTADDPTIYVQCADFPPFH